jgi:hypothetical protein
MTPFMSFRRTEPGTTMAFKLPSIPWAATYHCPYFSLGARLDRRGDNQGLPAGPEDLVLSPAGRVQLELTPGQQVNGVTITLPSNGLCT